MKQSQKKKGINFEKKAQLSINSGAVWFSPLDLSYENFCIEAKYTDQKGYRISLGLIEKIWNKALSMNKEPFLMIGIKRNDGQMFTLQCRINLEKR